MYFAVNPLNFMAAEIIGLDCSKPFTDEILQVVKQNFLACPVLVFRNQILTASELAAFGRSFGRLEEYGNPLPAAGKDNKRPQTAALHQTNARETPDQMLYLSPDDPDVLIMTNEIRSGLTPIGIVDNAEMWHSDGSHKPDPYQAIIVHVIRNPASGGDTEFCDLRAVYDALTPDVKAMLKGRDAVHHWSKSKNPRFAGTLDAAAREEGERIASMIPEMLQPIVRTHPETGYPNLYLSPRFTIRVEGVAEDISSALLNGIFTLMEDTRFHYRHEWRKNDLMIWDNRRLNHRVRSYPEHDIRCRHRVTVTGDRPFFRQASSSAN